MTYIVCGVVLGGLVAVVRRRRGRVRGPGHAVSGVLAGPPPAAVAGLRRGAPRGRRSVDGQV